jgi:hypothetical protein
MTYPFHIPTYPSPPNYYIQVSRYDKTLHEGTGMRDRVTCLVNGYLLWRSLSLFH